MGSVVENRIYIQVCHKKKDNGRVAGRHHTIPSTQRLPLRLTHAISTPAIFTTCIHLAIKPEKRKRETTNGITVIGYSRRQQYISCDSEDALRLAVARKTICMT